MPKIIFFDLDGTLSESKQPVSNAIADLLTKLLSVTRVAVISGGALSQFSKQVVAHLPETAKLANLYLLPTSGASLYEYQSDEWKKIYEERLSEKEFHTIEKVLTEVIAESGIINLSDQSWGERIEHRGGQVTFSALGQLAPAALKKGWDPDHAKRRVLQTNLAARLPEYEVSMGGSTSIDVTKRGIDKAYGINKLCDRLELKAADCLYVGDELQTGGNDAAVYKTPIATHGVTNPLETEVFLKSLFIGA